MALSAKEIRVVQYGEDVDAASFLVGECVLVLLVIESRSTTDIMLCWRDGDTRVTDEVKSKIKLSRLDSRIAGAGKDKGVRFMYALDSSAEQIQKQLTQS